MLDYPIFDVDFHDGSPFLTIKIICPYCRALITEHTYDTRKANYNIYESAEQDMRLWEEHDCDE